MRAPAKVAVVSGLYLVAVGMAAGAIKTYAALSNAHAAQTHAGLSSASDVVMFLGILALTSIPATTVMLHLFREHRGLWTGVGSLAALLALTGVIAAADFAVMRLSGGALLGSWSNATPIRFLVAPLFGLNYVVAAISAPPPTRRVLLGAITLEALSFAAVVFIWLQSK